MSTEAHGWGKKLINWNNICMGNIVNNVAAQKRFFLKLPGISSSKGGKNHFKSFIFMKLKVKMHSNPANTLLVQTWAYVVWKYLRKSELYFCYCCCNNQFFGGRIFTDILECMFKQTIQLKNDQRIWTFFHLTYSWSTDTWKDARHHQSSTKCKSKRQCHLTPVKMGIIR